MCLDGAARAYFDGLSGGGPAWLIAGAIVATLAFIAIKLVPMILNSRQVRDEAYVKKVDAEIELERIREERKNEEAQAHERRDIERSETEGRWIQLTEQMVRVSEESNQIVKAVSASLNALEAAITESRNGSKRLQEQMSVVYAKILNDGLRDDQNGSNDALQK